MLPIVVNNSPSLNECEEAKYLSKYRAINFKII